MKKGISPFIAEILLIGLAIAVAAVIITWGMGFTRTSTQNIQGQSETQMMCSYGGISTLDDVYYKNGYLYGYLRNSGNIPLRVNFQIVYDNGTVQNVQNVAPDLAPGSISFFNVSADPNINFVMITTNCTSPPVNYRIERKDVIFN